MRPVPIRLNWLTSGLFWRTFFLLTFLIAVSMAAWIASFNMVERTPRANQIAAQVVSIVTITRAALTHSAPDLRRELLFDLASNEGIRIYPLEESDEIKAPSHTGILKEVQANIRDSLGTDTRFARVVNDVSGFWVSFKIDDDEYWLMLDRERLENSSGIQWVGWATVTLALSLLGAALISGLINQPLARLTAATRAIARGQQPDPLPETGPNEIQEANRSFNQMVDDLNRIESDRAVVLAGISHDLRTPLTRMQLEVEMAGLSDDAREGMQSDLQQMDAIIGQFLDYARPTDSATFTKLDLSALLADTAREAERLPNVRIASSLAPHIAVLGNEIDLKRVFNNLIENARRYGQGQGGVADIDIACRLDGHHAVIEIGDRGNGVPEAEIERLLRPFTRLDTARGQANGSGLGLAIVERVVRRHGGKLLISNRSGGGLSARIVLAATGTARSRAEGR